VNEGCRIITMDAEVKNMHGMGCSYAKSVLRVPTNAAQPLFSRTS
jgi:hypothetical protein